MKYFWGVKDADEVLINLPKEALINLPKKVLINLPKKE